MKFFVPGKTFLVGEYAVLLGGVSLGLATKPCFEYSIDISNIEGSSLSPEPIVFHPNSPAGKFRTKNNSNEKIYFKDQYSEMGVTGGYGRSTAEYFASITSSLLKQKKSFFEILKDYKNLHSDYSIKPSGMDLAFQFFGTVTLADQALNFYQNFDWKFETLDFYLISTGVKVNTHEHIANLDLNKLKELPQLSNIVANSYSENKQDDFLYHMSQWCELLQSHNLTHSNTLELKNFLESHDVIKLVKPCGALGADVLIIFFDKINALSVKTHLVENNIKVCAHSSDLTNGLVSQLRSIWSQNVD
jgi:mevalonate kinase